MQIIHAVGQLIACQEPAHRLSAISREVEGAPNSAGALRASCSCDWFAGEQTLISPGGGTWTPPKWRQVRRAMGWAVGR